MMYNMIKNFSDFVTNETLKTHDIDLTLDNVKEELMLLRYDFSIRKKKTDKIAITLNNVDKMQIFGTMLNNLNSLLTDRHGWFPASCRITTWSDYENYIKYDHDYLLKNFIYYKTIEITYEAKYDVLAEKPDYVYHLTIQQFSEGINKKGLIPKSKNKLTKHLNRIYVCSDPEHCKSLVFRMNMHYDITYNVKINKDWIIYKIDLRALDIKLYRDPNYVNGFYIVDNIPPSNITVYDKK